MPSYLHPGVYIEEIPSSSRPIEGVATSITAFVGFTSRGVVNEPFLIGKLDDYLDEFGAISSETDAMGLAVQAFYMNGGGAAYICRVAKSGAKEASVKLATDALVVNAKSPGEWGNKLHIVVKNSATDTFDLEIGHLDTDDKFVMDEEFLSLSTDKAEDNYAILRVNAESSRISLAGITVNDPIKVPINIAEGAAAPLTGGVAAEATTVGEYTTFYDDILRKYRDISIIVLPGKTAPSDITKGIAATLAHCEKMKNRILIIDPDSDQELSDKSKVTALKLPSSTYTVLYYPWVLMANPLYHPDTNPTAKKTVKVAPSAIAAGMWAKIDGKRGVWKAPAGVETQLVGAAGLEHKVENLEQDQLNPLGINCIRSIPNYGSVFWGARTLATKAVPEWRYVPVRRTAIFIEESIYGGIQWAVFEPNDHPLWMSLRANIGSFMDSLFRAGAFQGKTSKEAYFVRCGLGDTMTQGDIDRGQVIVIVGFAPVKPAEFVIVRIQQKVGEE